MTTDWWKTAFLDYLIPEHRQHFGDDNVAKPKEILSVYITVSDYDLAESEQNIREYLVKPCFLGMRKLIMNMEDRIDFTRKFCLQVFVGDYIPDVESVFVLPNLKDVQYCLHVPLGELS